MGSSLPPDPQLSAIVVHWRGEDHLRALWAAWPDDPRFELVVVDNGSDGSLADLAAELGAGWVSPGRNLGFSGGVNAGARVARAPLLLILNPDIVPRPGALERLLEGFVADPAVAGLAPRLIGPDGARQTAWQLRPLPRSADLLLQACLVPVGGGPDEEPAGGSVVEQPAAAAQAVRRAVFDRLGGFDEAFYPAWFEDVDFARRLATAGERLRYHPAAEFRHHLGATVEGLGLGPFLWIYYRNLLRYGRKHHGAWLAPLARLLLPLAALLRILLLPLRRPRRARSRGQAMTAYGALALGALSGWRWPSAWRRLGETP
ncbi:MAG: glycosyltransferase [Acidobacteriota bacterium]